MPKKKRVAAITDPHCGAVTGLTHPDYDSSRPASRLGKLRREAWGWYAAKVKAVGPVDLLMVGGDCIDGKGEASGGTELLVADRHEQADMAVAAIKEWQAKKIGMVYGTPYHGGKSEDFEDGVAKDLGATIKPHDWFDITFGSKTVLTFDVKHFVSASSVPYGRTTSISKDEIWNLVWAEHEQQPRGDIFLRGHVHYCEGKFRFVKGQQKWALILPALQTLGTKFGSRKCSGHVDYGFVWWDIYENGDTHCTYEIAELRGQKAVAQKC